MSAFPTSAFAMKHQETTHLPQSAVNCCQIYTKKMKLRQLTAVEQGVSAVNCRQVSFLTNSKVGTTIIFSV